MQDSPSAAGACMQAPDVGSHVPTVHAPSLAHDFSTYTQVWVPASHAADWQRVGEHSATVVHDVEMNPSGKGPASSLAVPEPPHAATQRVSATNSMTRTFDLSAIFAASGET